MGHQRSVMFEMMSLNDGVTERNNIVFVKGLEKSIVLNCLLLPNSNTVLPLFYHCNFVWLIKLLFIGLLPFISCLIENAITIFVAFPVILNVIILIFIVFIFYCYHYYYIYVLLLSSLLFSMQLWYYYRHYYCYYSYHYCTVFCYYYSCL